MRPDSSRPTCLSRVVAAARRGRREAIVRVGPGAVARFIARHRRNPVLRLVSTAAQMYLSAFENEDWDLHRNGERRLLAAVASLSPDGFVAFDVGSFAGEWARLALAFDSREVHCFEVVEHVFSTLERDFADRPNVVLNRSGLWSGTGTLTGHFVPHLPTMSSLVPEVWAYTGAHGVAFDVPVETGDDYCARRGVTHIDFLKVDVEGAEFEVIRGFSKLFGDGAVDVVQFEYGPLTLAGRHSLQEYYAFFSDVGMVLGKIYPRYLRLFDRYYPGLDDFRWGNYVALRPAVVKRLTSAWPTLF
jgi:FkbM family methyltransferase